MTTNSDAAETGTKVADEPLESTTVVRRRPSPRVEWVEVEGEVVVWNEDTQDLHLLDPIASLIFQLCDGSATLHDTLLDLADAFGQPVDVIGDDVHGCLENLRTLGLVEVVG